MTRPTPFPDDPATRAFQRFRERGEASALTEVFDRVGPELMGLASHLAGDPAEAEDLVQETFLRAIERARRFDPRRRVTPWLVGILAHQARRGRRRRARRPDVSRAEAAGHGVAGADGVVSTARDAAERPALAGEVREAVARTLAALPPGQADVLRPVLLDGRSPSDIAADAGLAPGTVRVRLHRGLERLRRELPRGLAPMLAPMLATVGGLELAPRGLAAVRAEVHAAAVSAGPGIALAGTGALAAPHLPFFGVLVVTAKTAALAVAASGLALFLVTRTTPAVSVEPAVVGSSPTAEALEREPEPEPEPDLAQPTIAPSREEISEPTPVEAPAPPARVAPTRTVLRVQVTGLARAAHPACTLVVCEGTPFQELKKVAVGGDGPILVELDDVLGERAPDRLSAHLRGPGLIPSAAWSNRAELDPEGRRSYSVEVVARPLRRTLRGVAVAPSGKTIALRSWVEWVPEGADRSLPLHPFPEATLSTNGSFELPLDDESPGHLIVVAAGLRALAVEVDETQLGDVDLGDLQLEAGATIRGRAFGPAVAAGEAFEILAAAEHAPAAWNERARGVQAKDSRVHHRHVSTALEKDGTFELEGLEPGVRYTVTLVPRRAGRVRVELLGAEPPGVEVTAPASGVELEPTLTAVAVTVRDAAGPVRGAEVREVLAEDDPRHSIPEGLRANRAWAHTTNRNGQVVLLVPSDGPTRGAARADSRPEVEFEFVASELRPPAEGEVPTFAVVLEGAPEPTPVYFHVRYDGPGAITGARLYVRIFSNAGRSTVAGPLAIENGVARLEDAPPGSWLAAPFLHLPQTIALRDLPYDIGGGNTIPIPAAEGNEPRSANFELQAGGRLELRLVGRDPDLAPPEFTLVAESGQEVRPPLLTEDPRGHDTIRAIETDGPVLFGRALGPGTWVVKQTGAAYAPTEWTVQIDVGFTETLVAHLEPR